MSCGQLLMPISLRKAGPYLLATMAVGCTFDASRLRASGAHAPDAGMDSMSDAAIQAGSEDTDGSGGGLAPDNASILPDLPIEDDVAGRDDATDFPKVDAAEDVVALGEVAYSQDLAIADGDTRSVGIEAGEAMAGTGGGGGKSDAGGTGGWGTDGAGSDSGGRGGDGGGTSGRSGGIDGGGTGGVALGSGGTGGSRLDSGGGVGNADSGAIRKDSGGDSAKDAVVRPGCGGYPNAQSFVPSDGITHCYWLNEDKLAWIEAKTACETAGGELVSMLSSAENSFVRQLVDAANPSCWIGATDGKDGTDRSAPSTYTWVTGETWIYQNWAANQPDGRCDSCTASGSSCHCDHRLVIGSDGTWSDWWEGTKIASICEAIP